MLSLLCSSIIAVFATTEKVSNNFLGIETSLGIKVNTDITKEKARVYADIMRQLEAQGQTALFEHFKEAIAPEIEAEIYAKYGIIISDVTLCFNLVTSVGKDIIKWRLPGGTLWRTLALTT